MKLGPVRGDQLDFVDASAFRSARFGHAYSPPSLDSAPSLFLSGSHLPQRWSRRSRFVVLASDFGLGTAFLATWAAWRADPARCDRLWFIAIEPHPLTWADLQRAHRGCDWPDLAAELKAHWPLHTPDVHVLDLDQGRVRLMLVFERMATALPQIVAAVDAVYLRGSASASGPTNNDARSLRGLHRLAAPGATLVAIDLTPYERASLVTAGFVFDPPARDKPQAENDIAEFFPRSRSIAPAGRTPAQPQVISQCPVVVIGGGLAGTAVANALARQGVAVTVLDRHSRPAQGASGQPGGLYHGVVHPTDGSHARWLRAGALLAHKTYAPLVAFGLINGQTQGLLRGEHMRSLPAMRGLLSDQGLPAEWMQAWSAQRASSHSGVPWHKPAWFCGSGGWVAPADLCGHWLNHTLIEWRGQTSVNRLVRLGDEWQLHDAHGHELMRAPIVVLANAQDTVRLLGSPPGPWQSARGQVSMTAAAPGLHLGAAIADRGYAVPLPDGQLLYGATSAYNDDEPGLRASDHEANADTLHRLTGWRPAPAAAVHGRVGWRMQTNDRLPWVGPAPVIESTEPNHANQARFVPRRLGLYVLAALGSRGLTHAPLAGELLAAWITGAPMPVLSSLVDAVDVARFTARAAARLNRS